MRNKQGVGVAAHPDFSFGTRLNIPSLKGALDGDDEFTVIDRGSAVTKKKASKGKCYVFDVFVDRTGAEFRRCVSKLPEYGWVYIQ